MFYHFNDPHKESRGTVSLINEQDELISIELIEENASRVTFLIEAKSVKQKTILVNCLKMLFGIDDIDHSTGRSVSILWNNRQEVIGLGTREVVLRKQSALNRGDLVGIIFQSNVC